MLEGAAGGGVRELKESLRQRESVEIAGYQLNPELALYIESLRMSNLNPKDSPVCWIDVVSDEAQSLSPLTTQTSEKWRQENSKILVDTAVGAAFWATQEITDCPDLIRLTTERCNHFSL
jgi:hypothetical protein